MRSHAGTAHDVLRQAARSSRVAGHDRRRPHRPSRSGARRGRVAPWLRDEQLVEPTAALRWRSMMDEFYKDAGRPAPKQPRYTLDEYRRLLTTAWEADERYGLLLAVGAEYRLGQVARSYRRHLDRHAGELRVPGEGKKRGGVILFTDAQRAAVERCLTSGYLAGLEAAHAAGEIDDYPLWPGDHFATDARGALVSRAEYARRDPVQRTTIRAWHREAERLAKIPHVDGRGYYGLRRAAVDGAKEQGISRDGLRESGGWADTQMPDRVYADRDAHAARDEARKVRAKMRGEAEPSTATNDPKTSQIVTPPDAASGDVPTPGGADHA